MIMRSETMEPSTGALISHFNDTGAEATFCCGPLVARNNSVTCIPINGQSQLLFAIPQGKFAVGAAALGNVKG